MFLFAVGYGVGPQFVRGIAKDGVPQALFAVVVCVFCLVAPFLAAKIAGYDIGSAAGLYAGSQTISASMGLATDAINRLGLPPEETKRLLDAMPVAYAVTYIFGTVGSAIVLALLGPALLGIDLEAECKRYEEEHGGKKQAGGAGTAWHQLRTASLSGPDGRNGRRADGAGGRVADRRAARVCRAHPAGRADHGCDGGYRHPGGRHFGRCRPPRSACRPGRRRGRGN